MSSRRSNRGDGAKGVNPHEHVAKTSWWIAHAKPEDRDNFMAEANARSIERQRLENAREAKKVSVGIHLWSRKS